MGFFPESILLTSKLPPALVARCDKCRLYEQCLSPKMPVYGRGQRRILVLGEAPAQNEDQEGIPFIGNAGKFLREAFCRYGYDLERDCWVTNAVICCPHGVDGEWRNPTDTEIDYCRPNVLNAIERLNPHMVIPLGNAAIQSLLGAVWKSDVGSITRWVGWQIPYQKGNYWICPNYHPSFCLRQKDKVTDLWFHRHLEASLTKEGRPWEKVPDYRKQVMVVYDPKAAAYDIRQFIKQGKPVAVDIEADRLKPDGATTDIVCCAVSDGTASVAYPWHGEAIKATRELLKSGVPVIASNCKYESRFFIKFFGEQVKNWYWDTVLAAHTLDNRSGICGLKFQSFVLLGFESYSEHIEPFLKADGGNTSNRIREVELAQLLLYCGLDSLLEVMVARIQHKKLKGASS